jgi:hypothetical protein
MLMTIAGDEEFVLDQLDAEEEVSIGAPLDSLWH